MAKTQEEFQQEIAQLLVQAGEAQFMLRMFRKTIEEKNSELNTLNQKIEKVQKDFRTFLSQVPQQKAPEAAPEVTDATTSSQAV